MKKEYQVLIGDLLQQYHYKKENLSHAVGIADEVRQISLNDYAFRLNVGLEGLLDVAKAAGDSESIKVLDELVRACAKGNVPTVIYNFYQAG